jgi:hypothetical protein
LRKVKLKICNNILAYFDASLQKSQKMRTVLLFSSLDVVATVCKVLQQAFEIFRRIKGSFLEVVK